LPEFRAVNDSNITSHSDRTKLICSISDASGYDRAKVAEWFHEGRIKQKAEERRRFELENRRNNYKNRVKKATLSTPKTGTHPGKRPDLSPDIHIPGVPVYLNDTKKFEADKAKAAKICRELGQPDADPCVWPPVVYRAARLWQRDVHGVIRALVALPEGFALRLVEAASEGGHRSLTSNRAKATITIAAVVYFLGTKCLSFEFERLLAGYSIEALRLLTQSPNGGPYSRSAVANYRHGKSYIDGIKGKRGGKIGDARLGQCGILATLEQFEVFSYAQPNLENLPMWSRGPSGFAMNQYAIEWHHLTVPERTEPEEQSHDPPIGLITAILTIKPSLN